MSAPTVAELLFIRMAIRVYCRNGRDLPMETYSKLISIYSNILKVQESK